MKQCLTTLEILKSVDFTKIQESKYLKNKGNIFLRIKGYFIVKKNSFVVEVTFNTENRELNLKRTAFEHCPVNALIIDALIRGSLIFA